MSVKRINGVQLEQMLRNGLANLRLQEDEINRLNVFPVPDGDTGTNMVKTLEHGLELSESSTEVNTFAKSLSAGMLLGARGNSGVILSQFFYGFSQALSRSVLIGPGELRSALVRGYRTAYEAVLKPVEGTILSVAREGIEHIRGQITRSSPVDVILAAYVAEMRKTLAMTPEMLPVLKEARVVDSGGTGFIAIFEGMVKYLQGEILRDQAPAKAPAAPKGPDLCLFDENSAFVDGYCMEFILQPSSAGANPSSASRTASGSRSIFTPSLPPQSSCCARSTASSSPSSWRTCRCSTTSGTAASPRRCTSPFPWWLW